MSKEFGMERPVTGETTSDVSETGQSQLVNILEAVQQSPKILEFVAQKILERNNGRFQSVEDVKNYLATSLNSGESGKPQPLAIAKLIEKSLGQATMRTLRFLGTDPKAERDILKILEARPSKETFEQRAEKGLYTGILESYDVRWPYEKAIRDIWQNFNDANGYTLDGVQLNEQTEQNKKVVTISAPQTYDWRKLAHIGGTSKTADERSAGGFGEGTKILSLILLRDYGVKQVKFASGDWEIEFYLNDVPEESYDQKVRGLYIKKTKRQVAEGNSLELAFDYNGAEEPKAFSSEWYKFTKEQRKQFQDAEEIDKKTEKNIEGLKLGREFFYSSENEDFQNASFNNSETGGFKVIPHVAIEKVPIMQDDYEHARWGWPTPTKLVGYRDKKIPRQGHVYVAGQRTHYKDAKRWDTTGGVNIWTWKKLLEKDRDRGAISQQDMQKTVIPFILKSMTVEDKTKAVFEFQQEYWFNNFDDEGEQVFSSIIASLNKEGIKIEFEPQYLAGQPPFPPSPNNWIYGVVAKAGYKLCRGEMAGVGMNGTLDKFLELESQFRTPETQVDKTKISVLQKAYKSMGLEKREIWLYEKENEKNIHLYTYNGSILDNEIFYWLDKDVLNQDLRSVLVYCLQHTLAFMGAIEKKYREAQSGFSSDDYKRIAALQAGAIDKKIADLEKNGAFQTLENEWNTVVINEKGGEVM